MSPLTEPTRLTLRKSWQPMDADAAAYITAVEAADTAAGQSGGLEEKTKIAIDNFVLGCKADGIWTAIKASCILAGARTRQGALVPLRNEYDFVNNLQPDSPQSFGFVDADYNRKTGLKGNATTKYLNSNRNNNADPQDSQHLAVYVKELRTVGSRFYMASDYQVAGTSSISDVDSRSRSSAPENVLGNALGLIANSRSLAASYVHRVSGVNSSKNRLSAAPGSSDIHVFGSSNVGAPLRIDARLAFYSIGESLDLALLDARVTDLITAIGVAF